VDPRPAAGGSPTCVGAFAGNCKPGPPGMGDPPPASRLVGERR